MVSYTTYIRGGVHYYTIRSLLEEKKIGDSFFQQLMPADIDMEILIQSFQLILPGVVSINEYVLIEYLACLNATYESSSYT